MRIIILSMALFMTNNIHAENPRLISGDYSIYNINTGILAYAPARTLNGYVYGLPAYYVDKYANAPSELDNANWSVKESSYGSGRYILKNSYSGLCLNFYGVGYQPTQTACSPDNNEQLWLLMQHPTHSGSFTIKSAKNDSICLYSWPGDTDYYLYTDECTKYQNLSDWAFVSPLRRGYHNP